MRGTPAELKTINGVLHKKCIECQQFKTLDNFYTNDRYTGGVSPLCRPCTSIYYKRRNTKEKNKKDSLRSKYNITIEQYQNQYDKQKGTCPICFNYHEVLCVDHDHKTNKFRGLICNSCNLALGYFKDNILNLKSAINYLEAFELHVMDC